MISLTLALCLYQAPLKDVHIGAMPLEKAVAQLSNIYHSPMDISTLLRGKVIIIEANQVSESEVRDQIAKTVNASWEKKENLWHLTKSAKQQEQDVQRGVAMRSRFLKKTIEIRQKSLQDKPELTPTSAIQMFHQLRNEEKKAQDDKNYMQPPGPSAAGYGMPNHRFLSRFLLKFGPDRIAAIPNGHRAVFALHPNAMQMPMGIDIDDLLAKYRAEQDTWLNSAGPLMREVEGVDQTNGERISHIGNSQQLGYDLESSFGSMPPELKDVLFSVYCSDDGAYQFRIVGIPQGEALNIMYDIKGTTFEGAFAGMEASDFQDKPVEGFRLSQETDDFKHFFENGFEQVPLDRQKGLLTKLSDPVTRDPLSYGLTEALVFDAKRTKHNIVALGFDSQLNVFQPIFGDMLFQPRFRDLLQDFVSTDEKWIRMFEPPFSEPNLPRIEFKRLIANARESKKVSIFDRAAIAAYKNRNSAVSYTERLLDKFAEVSEENNSNPDALKLVGLLTEGERQVAFSGNGVRFGQLNLKAQQHLFECCFFNEHIRLQFIDQTKRPKSNAIASEPTYLLPTGIPNNAILQVSQKVKAMIKNPDDPDHGNLMTDAFGWGETIYQAEHPEDYPRSTYKFDKKRKLFRIQETIYDFKLRLGQNCEWQATMSSAERVGTDMFTIDSLPDDLKFDFEAGYKAAAESAKLRREQAKKNGGGGGYLRQS